MAVEQNEIKKVITALANGEALEEKYPDVDVELQTPVK